MSNNENIVWHDHHVTKQERSKLKNQKSCILWFTGLSGSGKSTIANAVESKLLELQKHTYLLDGDNAKALILEKTTMKLKGEKNTGLYEYELKFKYAK